MWDIFSTDDDYKERPKKRANVENKGVLMVEKILSEEFDWVFIKNVLENDYGIDAYTEIAKNGDMSGKLIAIQIKTGQSYLKSTNEDEFIFRGEKKHLGYWLNHSLPVIIILCDEKNNKCYWKQVLKDDITKTEKGWHTSINKNSILDINSKEKLSKIVDKSEYQKRLDALLVAKPWMDEIINGNEIILEADEWINKSSGRGSIKISLKKEDDKYDEPIRELSNVYFPMSDYKKIFPKIFPWAEISIDSEFYEEYDDEDFFTEHCYKDDDTKELVRMPGYSEAYGEYRASLPQIRPYIIDSGEVARYRLILDINDFGKSFYNIDSYLREENKMHFLLKEVKEDIRNEYKNEEKDTQYILKESIDKLTNEKRIELEEHIELKSLVNNFIIAFNNHYRYIKSDLMYTSCPILDHMKEELTQIYILLVSNFYFSDFMIKQFTMNNPKFYNDKVTRVKTKKLMLIEALKQVYEYENYISEYFYNEKLIEIGLDDQYIELEKKHDNFKFLLENPNEYLRIKSDCKELNMLKKEYEKRTASDDKFDQSLFYLVNTFFNEFRDILSY